MARTILSTSCLLLLAACAAPEPTHQYDPVPRTVRIDGFTMAQRAQVLRAVNEANAAGGKYTIVDAGPADVSIAEAQTGYNEHRLAIAVPIGPGKGLIGVFTRNLGRRDLCGIVGHELGHIAGKAHDDHGIMAPTYGPDTVCR